MLKLPCNGFGDPCKNDAIVLAPPLKIQSGESLDERKTSFLLRFPNGTPLCEKCKDKHDDLFQDIEEMIMGTRTPIQFTDILNAWSV